MKDNIITNEFFNPKPCVGCGYCCIKSPCWVSIRLYGDGIAECPALIWSTESKRYVCDLCTKEIIGKDYKEELFIGEGCCCGLNNWRLDVKPRREKDFVKTNIFKLDPLFQKFLRSMAREWISSDTIFFIISGLKQDLLKDGESKEMAENISKSIYHCLTENKHGYIEKFMG